MSLVDRVNRGVLELRGRGDAGAASRFGIDDLEEYFSFGGNSYPVVQTTMGTVDEEKIAGTANAGFKSNGPVFALVMARLQAFSQVRFQWTQFVGSQPGDLFGTPELAVLERPWPGGTTSDLLARMEIHASMAGCAFIIRPKPGRLSMLRPDRVTIIMGSQSDADDPSEAPDCEIAGFIHTTHRGKITTFFPNEVAYYAPIPDPDYRFLGMSWITPVIREMQADGLATEHKARFFQNAATPNMAIKFDPTISVEQVKRFKAVLESEHRGAWNAYKTLYLGGGADPVVIGKDFQQLDFAATQGKGESRLAAAAGVPPSWVGFSEGLQGSSLNSGNFQAARRRFSDGTMFHLWTSAATSLETLLKPPNSGASLWFDDRVPFMREDAGDLAGIQQQQAATLGGLVRDGWTPESSVKALVNNDWTLLKHTGWYSVQMQPPGQAPPANGQSANGQGAKPAPNGQSVGVGQ
jgi:phage portal protein BeeE